MTARARILVLGAIVLTLIVVGGAERLTAQAQQAAVPSPAQIRPHRKARRRVRHRPPSKNIKIFRCSREFPRTN